MPEPNLKMNLEKPQIPGVPTLQQCPRLAIGHDPGGGLGAPCTSSKKSRAGPKLILVQNGPDTVSNDHKNLCNDCDCCSMGNPVTEPIKGYLAP